VDRRPDQPLTPVEAKARLRRAAGRVGWAPWVRRHPRTALLGGFAAGFLAGSLSPRGRRRAAWLLEEAALAGLRLFVGGDRRDS